MIGSSGDPARPESPPLGASPIRLVVVSGSALLDHRRAHRGAYLPMLDQMAEAAGIPSALLAKAFDAPPPAGGRAPPAGGSARREKLAAAAAAAVTTYLEQRDAATRPPEGLGEALSEVKSRISAGRRGAPEMIGLSPLPAAVLSGYLSKTRLREILDRIYCMSGGAAGDRESGPVPPWIVALPERSLEPSAALLKSLCERHGTRTESALLLGGDLGGDVRAALEAGMKAIYLRLGIFDDKIPPQPAGSRPRLPDRQPDAVIVRLADLPGLALFAEAPAVRPGPSRGPSGRGRGE